MDDIMEFADESVIELAEMNQAIEMFTESALNLIDNMEQSEYVRAAYFTEAAADDEDAAHNKANKNILAKICESIAKIFSKLAALVSKGKTKVKSGTQSVAMGRIAKQLKDFPDVKVTIQDVWSFNQFADKTIDTYIKKFNKGNITMFWKTVKGDKAIVNLTKSMNLLATQMRSPSNKKFVVKGPGISGKSVAAALGAAAAGATAADYGKNYKKNYNQNYAKHTMVNGDAYLDGDDYTALPYPTEIALRRQSMKGVATKPLLNTAVDIKGASGVAMSKAKSTVAKIAGDAKAAPNKIGGAAKAGWDKAKTIPGKIPGAPKAALNKSKAAFTKLEFDFTQHKDQVITAAVITALVTAAVVFTSCPKKIGTEKVSIKELYKRLTSLAPEKFPSMVADTAKKVNTYMQKSDTLLEFSKTLDGSKGAIRYSQEISNLLAAYTAFHQGLIDFYLNIITSVLKAGGVTNSKKIYTAESVDDVDSEDHDEYEESYDESYDDTDYEESYDDVDYDDSDDETDYSESEDHDDNSDDEDDYTESEMYTNDDFTDLDSFIEANMSDMSC